MTKMTLDRFTLAPERVFTLGYRWREPQFDGHYGTVSFDFAATKGVTGTTRVTSRKSFTCTFPVQPIRHWRPGVSETVGLTYSGWRRTDDEQSSRFLERNISDLVTMHVCEAAKEPNSTVVVMGPPLPKIIGRLASRCLRNDLTVAFFSWEEGWQLGPELSGYGPPDWSGPFPSLHEDWPVRTFYHQPPSGRHVRVDFFCQLFAGRERSVDVLSILTERLAVLDRLIRSHPFLDVNGRDEVRIPFELGLLGRSLRWNSDDFWAGLQRNEIKERITSEQLERFRSEGIVALEPVNRLAARLGTEDRGYLTEVLYSELEVEVERRGLVQGFINFLGEPN